MTELNFDGPVPHWIFPEASGFPFHTAPTIFGGLDTMLAKLVAGRLRAFGDPEKSGAYPEWIAPRAWNDLRSDPTQPRRCIGGGSTFWHVRVIDIPEVFTWLKIFDPTFDPNAVVILRPIQAERSSVQLRAAPVDYREEDEKLVHEMHRLIESGQASGPMDAARALADRAKGQGNTESKAKRLLVRWKQFLV